MMDAVVAADARAGSPPISRKIWSAIGSMSMCVALLIASEFMPVSLLTPIARELQATDGMAGQAISISGLFAVITSLFIANVAARMERRRLLLILTGSMLASLVLIAAAPNFVMLMIARAFLGITIGGFWALSTATIMRLVPLEAVPKALGALYMGNAVSVAFAAPLGSFLGGLIGWRGVFWALVPFVAINIVWQWRSLPLIPPTPSGGRSTSALRLLKRRHVAFAMLAAMLSFAGAFSTFTYLRTFLENRTGVDVTQLSLILLGAGLAGFVGTYGASALLPKRLYRLLSMLPLLLAGATVAFLLLGHNIWAAAFTLIAWGGLNAAIPVAWSTWLSQGIADDPDAGGGLLVAAIQLSIMLGAAVGGFLLDHLSLTATWLGGAGMLVAAAIVAGGGRRLQGELRRS